MESQSNPQTTVQLRRCTRLAAKRIPAAALPSQPVPKKKQNRKHPSQAETRDIEDYFSQDEANSVRASLLGWYDLNQRDLPWRRRKDGGSGDEGGDAKEKRAYEVWVSEVMLQQTQVCNVVSYFNRWMERWPTVHRLANASQEEVNEMWAGLGFYRRARFLLEGAKSIAKERRFPRNAKELLGVPGIGKYTAGAIASIAFNEAVPVVDGNVVRVISRLKAISSNPKDSSTVKLIWDLAEQLIDKSRPGDLNQALMELGATICTPRNPNCTNCPVSEECRALSLATINKSTTKVTDFPVKVVKAKQRLEFAAVCVVILQKETCENQIRASENLYLLVKRPEEGLLAGGWSQLENQGQNCQVTWKFVHENTIESMGLTSGIRKVYNMSQEFRTKQMLPNLQEPKRKLKTIRS